MHRQQAPGAQEHVLARAPGELGHPVQGPDELGVLLVQEAHQLVVADRGLAVQA